MKSVITVFLLALLILPCANASEVESYTYSRSHGSSGTLWSTGDIDFDIEDGSIIMTQRGRHKSRIEITEDYKLYVDGELIETTPEQEKLVAEYYTTSKELVEKAKEIGLEGAKIGLIGAGIGLKAVGGVLKAIFTEYEFEDLEAELDDQTEELQERADELEERAEVIEDLAADLEDVFDEMVY
ncbi:MAG: DUF2884 family protein, partial [Candidatus Zixiibacteriota bacterium]